MDRSDRSRLRCSRTKAMVVVVGERTPLWAVLAVIIIMILVVVAVLIFILNGGRGSVLVIAIPGFPTESIILGLTLGVLLVALKRKSSGKRSSMSEPCTAFSLLYRVQ